MNAEFNPYRHWLGLENVGANPTYFELLQLQTNVEDPSTITQAADRALATVRSCRPGDRGSQWAALLDELSTAKATLLDADKRSAYRHRLTVQSSNIQASLQSGSAGAAEPQESPPAPGRITRPLPYQAGGPPASNTPIAPTLNAQAQDPNASYGGHAAANTAAPMTTPGYGHVPMATPATTTPAATPTPPNPAFPGLPLGNHPPAGGVDPMAPVGSQPYAPAPNPHAVTPPAHHPYGSPGPDPMSPAGGYAGYTSPNTSPQNVAPSHATQPNGAMAHPAMAAAPLASPMPAATGDPMAPAAATSGSSVTGPSTSDAVSVVSKPTRSSGSRRAKQMSATTMLLAAGAVTTILIALIVILGQPPQKPASNEVAQGGPNSPADSPQATPVSRPSNQPAAPARPSRPATRPSNRPNVGTNITDRPASGTPLPTTGTPLPATGTDPAPTVAPGPNPSVVDTNPSVVVPPSGIDASSTPGPEMVANNPSTGPSTPNAVGPDAEPMSPETAPPTEPVEPPTTGRPSVSPEQETAARTGLKSARDGLLAWDLAKAEQAIGSVEKMQLSEDTAMMLMRLRLLIDYAKGYDDGIRQAIDGFNAGDAILLRGDTRVAIVEVTPNEITIRASARNKTFQRRSLPPVLSTAIAKSWFDSSAGSKACQGTYLQLNPDVRAEDKTAGVKLWDEAGQGGIEIDELRSAIADDYGV